MDSNVTVAIISAVISPIVGALLGWIGWLLKKNKKLKKRNKAQAELLNYGAGWVDTVLDEKVKMRPDLKKTGLRFSKKYHKLDILKDVKEEEEDK